MRSNFGRQSAGITATTQPFIDESYDLKGLNLTLPDQVMPKGQTPLADNSRMYARNDGDARVAIRTRKGSTSFMTPIGETEDTTNTDTSTGDLSFTTTRIVAQPFEATAAGALTMLELELKKAAGATGHIIVEIATDNGGIPGTVIAESSILASDVTTSYQYLGARFMDAPDLALSTQYWIIAYIQDNGSGTYYINQTADSGALDLQSLDSQVTWSSLDASFRFKSYVSDSDPIKGFTRRYPSDGADRTLIAVGSSIYAVQDNGTSTEIDSALSAGSDYTRFAFVDDKSAFVNGVDAARWWDGTTSTNITGAPLAPRNVIVHQGRMFFLTDKTKVNFSDLYNFLSYPSVNFFYVPSPKSADPVTAWHSFQDNLVIFTHETKHIVYGTDISSFTRKEAVGTKGAVSQEATAVDRNYIYFMADDGQIYRFNGVSDELLSQNMESEFNNIQDKSKVRLHLYRNQLRVYYAKTPTTQNNRMALLDLEFGEWFIDTGKSTLGSLEFTQDDNELVEFSSKVGQMFNGEQSYSDMGKAIDWKYYTNYKIYGSGASRKRIKRFRPVVRTQNANYTLLVGKDMDYNNTPDMREYVISGGGAQWGAFVWGDGTKWGKKKIIDRKSAMSGRGRHIQYRFERKGVETPVELYGYISQIKEGRPK